MSQNIVLIIVRHCKNLRSDTQQDSLAQHWNPSGRQEVADKKYKWKGCGINEKFETYHPVQSRNTARGWGQSRRRVITYCKITM
jgi:hypothetical protein